MKDNTILILAAGGALAAWFAYSQVKTDIKSGIDGVGGAITNINPFSGFTWPDFGKLIGDGSKTVNTNTKEYYFGGVQIDPQGKSTISPDGKTASVPLQESGLYTTQSLSGFKDWTGAEVLPVKKTSMTPGQATTQAVIQSNISPNLSKSVIFTGYGSLPASPANIAASTATKKTQALKAVSPLILTH